MPDWRSARIVVAATMLLFAGACDDAENSVRWTAALEGPRTIAAGEQARVRVTGVPDRGWYFYSLAQRAGGPIAARLWLADTATFRSAGAVTAPSPSRSFDKTFGMTVEKYSSEAAFLVPVRAASDARSGRAEILVSARYQACNNNICLSPRTVTLSVPVAIR